MKNDNEQEYLYQVHEVKQLTDTIYRLVCKAQLNPIAFSTGQYVKILCGDHRFRNFSIASADFEPDLLEFHLRIRGHNYSFLDFLSDNKNQRLPIHVKGPYGLDPVTLNNHDELLLIAKGLGIAPFISILKSLSKKNAEKSIKLIWFLENTEDDYLTDFLTDCKIKIPGFDYHIFKDHEPFDDLITHCQNCQNALLFISGGEELLAETMDFIRRKKLIVKDIYSDIN